MSRYLGDRLDCYYPGCPQALSGKPAMTTVVPPTLIYVGYLYDLLYDEERKSGVQLNTLASYRYCVVIIVSKGFDLLVMASNAALSFVEKCDSSLF
jgi:hypothetical protein